MDASQFKPSQNVEDYRNDPWRYLYATYPYVGLTRAPTDIASSILASLLHPSSWMQSQAPQYDMTPSPPGSMAAQAGRNDFLKLLLQSGTNPGDVRPVPNGLLGGMFGMGQ